ncbi:MAG: chorismate-binding protein, partial [Lachnospiraceae bacterium]
MSKILIVEDEVAIADLERDYLELSGFEVEVAHEGERGLLKALKEDFDLLILDIMLPGIDGFEICRKVREDKNVPIIMVSAKKDDIDKIRGLGLGADDYMTKPFSPSELVARVKAHLARYERLIGSNIEENIRNKKALQNSEKDKSELLMIVDLERNDLSKLCEPHSIKVHELFKIEEYSTVYHLVSDISGKIKAKYNEIDCIRACFPGGSITGAPKIRSMEVMD